MATDPDDDQAWRDAGFDAEQVATFREWRIDLQVARQWRDAGVDDGLSATRWSILGASPGDVRDLERAGIDLETGFAWRSAGFDLEQARQAVADGTSVDDAKHSRDAMRFRPPPGPGVATGVTVAGAMPMFGAPGSRADLFQRAQAAGVDMQLLHGYVARHWVDGEAIAWAAQGIDVSDAYLWHDLGLTAAEAGRLSADGSSLVTVLRAWWSTGIPFAELAAWIGAGLTPDEAVEQRAKGVTVEHAAALRALRSGEAEQPSVGSVREPRWGPPDSGQPPDDEDAARDAIHAAFAAMTVRDGEAVPAVEDGHNLGPSLVEAQSRAPQHGQSSAPDAANVTVDRLRFVGSDEAIVFYTLRLASGLVLSGRPGRALVVDGEWKVARATFCDLVAMVGVVCPPP